MESNFNLNYQNKMLSQIDFKGQKMMLLSIVVLMVAILWAFFGFNQLKSGNSFQDDIVDWIIENAIKSPQPTAPALLKSLWKSKLGDLKFNTDEMIYSTSDNYESLALNEKTKDANLKDLFDNSQDTKIIAFGNKLSNKTYVLKKDGTGTLDGNVLNKEDLKTIGKDISTIAIGSFSEKKANEIINKHFPRGSKVKLDEDKYLVAIDMVSNGNNVKLAQTNTPSSTTTPSTTRVIIPATIVINGKTYPLQHVGEELNNSNKNQTLEENVENGKKQSKITLSEDSSHNVVGAISEEKIKCNTGFENINNQCLPESSTTCLNPIYLDANGVTVKVRDCAEAGKAYQWNGETWYVARDRDDMIEKSLSLDLNNRYPLTRMVTSRITDMHKILFDAADRDFNGDIGHWDTSNVTNMKWLFKEMREFNHDLKYWDVSKVTDMNTMFYDAKSFNKDISSWKVSNVTDMSFMFLNAFAFNQDIWNWNTSNVTNMQWMFMYAKAFDQDISNWNVNNVSNWSRFSKSSPIDWTNKIPEKFR